MDALVSVVVAGHHADVAGIGVDLGDRLNFLDDADASGKRVPGSLRKALWDRLGHLLWASPDTWRERSNE